MFEKEIPNKACECVTLISLFIASANTIINDGSIHLKYHGTPSVIERTTVAKPREGLTLSECNHPSSFYVHWYISCLDKSKSVSEINHSSWLTLFFISFINPSLQPKY